MEGLTSSQPSLAQGHGTNVPNDACDGLARMEARMEPGDGGCRAGYGYGSWTRATPAQTYRKTIVRRACLALAVPYGYEAIPGQLLSNGSPAWI